MRARDGGAYLRPAAIPCARDGIGAGAGAGAGGAAGARRAGQAARRDRPQFARGTRLGARCGAAGEAEDQGRRRGPCMQDYIGSAQRPARAKMKGVDSAASAQVTPAPDRRHPAPAGREEAGPNAPSQAKAAGGAAGADILTIYGILQHRYGLHDEALESCNAAALASPGYPPAHAGRARALAGLGRPDEALDAFCDAIACDPGCAPAYADYALAVTRLGCYNDAVAAYKEAIRLAPDSGDVHAGHAFALAGAGRLEDALEACKMAALLDPESAAAHAARGRVLAGMGRDAKALTAFDRAVELDCGSAAAHAGRGLALESLGRHAEALPAFDRAVELDGGSAAAHAGRGLALESLGRHAEALSAYERAIGIDEYHELAVAGIGRAGRRASRGESDGGGCPDPHAREGGAGDSEAARGGRGPPPAGIGHAMDPDHASARGYIEYCLAHRPRGGGRTPIESGMRSPPLTAEEWADIKESASSSEVVVMDGSEFVDMIRKGAATTGLTRCDES